MKPAARLRTSSTEPRPFPWQKQLRWARRCSKRWSQASGLRCQKSLAHRWRPSLGCLEVKATSCISVVLGLLLLGLGSACSSSGSGAKHPVRLRAPFDLDCPAEQIEYQRLDSSTIGVSGCGQRATYVKVCRDSLDSTSSLMLDMPVTETKCQWVMNTARN